MTIFLITFSLTYIFDTIRFNCVVIFYDWKSLEEFCISLTLNTHTHFPFDFDVLLDVQNWFFGASAWMIEYLSQVSTHIFIFAFSIFHFYFFNSMSNMCCNCNYYIETKLVGRAQSTVLLKNTDAYWIRLNYYLHQLWRKIAMKSKRM